MASEFAELKRERTGSFAVLCSSNLHFNCSVERIVGGLKFILIFRYSEDLVFGSYPAFYRVGRMKYFAHLMFCCRKIIRCLRVDYYVVSVEVIDVHKSSMELIVPKSPKTNY